MSLKLDADELMAYFGEIFPQVHGDFAVDRLVPMEIDMRLLVGDRHLRPGGTVSGPSMFTLADVAVYGAILGVIGRKALAVTTNCSIDFMRKPAANTDLLAKCKILKLGKLLAIGDVMIYSVGMDDPVARATLTYAIPPNK